MSQSGFVSRGVEMIKVNMKMLKGGTEKGEYNGDGVGVGDLWDAISVLTTRQDTCHLVAESIVIENKVLVYFPLNYVTFHAIRSW